MRVISRADGVLLAAIGATVVLWNVPYGEYVLYPFRIFATWMHEMGHGMAALLVGRDFVSMSIRPDTSGLTLHAGASGRLALAFVASAGYMGASIAGATLLVLGRTDRTARLVLLGLGVVAIGSAVLWARNLFGLVAIPVLGGLLVGFGLLAPRSVTSFLLNLLAAQSAVCALSDIRALFLVGASSFDGGGRTDAASVADLLLLPYWFWASLWMALSVVLLGGALYLRRRRGS